MRINDDLSFERFKVTHSTYVPDTKDTRQQLKQGKLITRAQIMSINLDNSTPEQTLDKLGIGFAQDRVVKNLQITSPLSEILDKLQIKADLGSYCVALLDEAMLNEILNNISKNKIEDALSLFGVALNGILIFPHPERLL